MQTIIIADCKFFDQKKQTKKHYAYCEKYLELKKKIHAREKRTLVTIWRQSYPIHNFKVDC